MADLRAYQPSFTAGELSPALYARVDLAKYASGLKTALNLFLHPHGGVSNRAGFEYINRTKNSADRSKLIPFEFNTEQAYMLEFGDLYARVYRGGGLVLASASKSITGVTQANPGVVTSVAHGYADGTEIDVSGVLGMTSLNGSSWVIADATTDTFTLTDMDGNPVDTSALPAYTSGGTIHAVYEFVTPYATADVGDLVFVQEADVMYIVHTSYAPRKLSRTGDDAWSITTPTFAPTLTAPTGPAAAATTGSGSTTYKYKVAAIAVETAEESLPTAEVTCTNDLDTAGNKNTVSWTAVAGAARYVVYKEDNGVFGYIGGTEGTSFVDENITADLSDTPQQARNPFTGDDNYPRCATFIDQRLAFASSNNNPQAVWTSQSGSYENFGVSSPAKQSDAITFRIRARQVNEIRAILPLRGLMTLTSGAEWIVTGADTKYLTPNVEIDNQGYRGCAKVQPVIVGNVVLFAQARGGVIRDFSYEFTEDSFVGKDLTILARHLFENKNIKAWAYAQAPYSIVWVVLDDGSLVSLTYLKEHDVWGWTRHQTDGVFEDVAVIAEGNEDVPYFIIRRTVKDVDRRYVERLHTRVFDTIADAFFVDSGLTYSGDPISSLYAPHLAGRDVVALVDGNVVKKLHVDDDGKVELKRSGSKIHLGLPYEAALQTLDLDLGSVKGLGTVQGRWKTVSEATLRVEKTRGIWTGPTEEDLTEYKQRAGEAWNEAIQAFTGDITITPNWDWTKGGTTWVKQFDPLPMTILSLMPDMTIGG